MVTQQRVGPASHRSRNRVIGIGAGAALGGGAALLNFWTTAVALLTVPDSRWVREPLGGGRGSGGQLGVRMVPARGGGVTVAVTLKE